MPAFAQTFHCKDSTLNISLSDAPLNPVTTYIVELTSSSLCYEKGNPLLKLARQSIDLTTHNFASVFNRMENSGGLL